MRWVGLCIYTFRILVTGHENQQHRNIAVTACAYLEFPFGVLSSAGFGVQCSIYSFGGFHSRYPGTTCT